MVRAIALSSSDENTSGGVSANRAMVGCAVI
jgi:hypothetical protein